MGPNLLFHLNRLMSPIIIVTVTVRWGIWLGKGSSAYWVGLVRVIITIYNIILYYDFFKVAFYILSWYWNLCLSVFGSPSFQLSPFEWLYNRGKRLAWSLFRFWISEQTEHLLNRISAMNWYLVLGKYLLITPYQTTHKSSEENTRGTHGIWYGISYIRE